MSQATYSHPPQPPQSAGSQRLHSCLKKTPCNLQPGGPGSIQIVSLITCHIKGSNVSRLLYGPGLWNLLMSYLNHSCGIHTQSLHQYSTVVKFTLISFTSWSDGAGSSPCTVCNVHCTSPWLHPQLSNFQRARDLELSTKLSTEHWVCVAWIKWT